MNKLWVKRVSPSIGVLRRISCLEECNIDCDAATEWRNRIEEYPKFGLAHYEVAPTKKAQASTWLACLPFPHSVDLFVSVGCIHWIRHGFRKRQHQYFTNNWDMQLLASALLGRWFKNNMIESLWSTCYAFPLRWCAGMDGAVTCWIYGRCVSRVQLDICLSIFGITCTNNWIITAKSDNRTLGWKLVRWIQGFSMQMFSEIQENTVARNLQE